jgi:hypothetical protein
MVKQQCWFLTREEPRLTVTSLHTNITAFQHNCQAEVLPSLLVVLATIHFHLSRKRKTRIPQNKLGVSKRYSENSFNPLQASGYNFQKLHILPKECIYMFLMIPKTKVRLFLYTMLIKELGFVMKRQRVDYVV